MQKTGYFYSYQDRYGWTIGVLTGSPAIAYDVIAKAPRTFATRADADADADARIRAACEQ
jgi:hypothetical protein